MKVAYFWFFILSLVMFGCGSSSGSGANSSLGTLLGSCDYTGCTGGGVCNDFYSGALPAMPNYAAVQSACNSNKCSSGTGSPTPSTSPCSTSGRSGSCTIYYTQEVVHYYSATTSTTSAQSQCTAANSVPGGSSFVANQ